ncbi:ABC transporter ATP-binding protein [Ancylobacter defluvii]|uniref:ABC transporter ATP-binding protein n=1 Tax=Ancylobacter defluvii TaxID=1282440 RepID=A0A9W6K1Y6_9HYPH|nr:ABC transporter ATP-binding protein [Ancylobacter defluvii]MBS7586920.1 ABC transporter ATP-binding protein [Ancylobacter defluvii]GLK86225.1 ABC transporter ATP-binding protein [Ancylobacter defluvii]
MLAPAIETARETRSAAPVLEARGLTLDYATERGPVRAVDAVDFTIAEGERLVLLGPSGCGKSSILKAAAGFLPPTAGTLSLRGRPINGPGPDRIVVFQEFDQLLPWKTVLDNVAFPLVVARRKKKGEAREIAADTLRRVGLERVLNSYPHTLSGGMKQRAAIARALAASPDVLLMDEPFAALDALTRLQMQRDLIDIARETGLTLLFVTHDIDEAVLIGTRLHLLSAHPGRTITTLDASAFDIRDLGTAAFETVSRKVHDTLFGRTRAAS